MKFLTLADWTGMVETDLFTAETSRAEMFFLHSEFCIPHLLYPVLEVTATVGPFENGRGFSLRALWVGKPHRDCHCVHGSLVEGAVEDRGSKAANSAAVAA